MATSICEQHFYLNLNKIFSWPNRKVFTLLSGDPEGWYTLSPLSITASLFGICELMYGEEGQIALSSSVLHCPMMQHKQQKDRCRNISSIKMLLAQGKHVSPSPVGRCHS